MPLSITFKPNEINEYLRVDPGQDVNIIETIKLAAMEEALSFLNTDFSTTVTNGDGSTTTTVGEAPTMVKEWVLNRMAQKYENRGNPVNPDYSTIQRYRKLNFSGFRGVNEPITEWDIINGAD